MRKVLLIFAILVTSIGLLTAKSNEIYFNFDFSSRSQLDEINRIVSVDNIKEGKVFAYANEEQFELFQKLEIEYNILPHPGTLYQPRMTSSIRELREWDTYPTYEAYVEIMYQFAEDYPELCTVEDIGTTVEGRSLLVAKISDNVNIDEAEAEFFYSGTMHGDETTGYVLLIRLIDYLLENYGNDDYVTNMVNNMEIWINPNANPDGTYHGGNNTVYNAQRYNGNNVDLNRNFPDPEEGQHPDGYTWQPETIAMMEFAEAHHFVMAGNFHGGTEVVNYPWDTWSTLHADDEWYQYVSHLYADSAQENGPTDYFDGYDDGITNGYQWYTISGSRQDYMNYFQNCRELTIEISDVKLVPESQLEPHWNYNKDAMLLYMEQAMYGFGGLITDDNNNPVMAELTVNNHDNNNAEVKTDPVIGDYHRPIEPGTWEITVSAYGYQEQTINNINTSIDNLTELDIQMIADPSSIEVTGEILNSQTNEPVANANIEILNKDIAPKITDVNGLAVFYLYAETIDFRVTAPGYETTEESVTISNSNTNFTIFINLGPRLVVDQNQIDVSLYTGESSSDQILVSNTGGVTLDFSAFIREPSTRNIADAYVTCQSTTFTPGQSYDWIFTIFNESTDGEWIKGLSLDFPQGIIVNEASDMIGGSGGSMVYDGSNGNAANVHWHGETSLGYGVLHDGQIATSTVNVTIDDAVSENLILDYTLIGDGYGVDPHEVTGTMEIVYPFGWLQIDPNNGTLESGESLTIDVDIVTTGLEAGEYELEILLTDFGFNNVIIPVHLDLENTESNEHNIPLITSLTGNYPNPFNPETTIKFSLAHDQSITLEVFNIKGERVRSLAKGFHPAGNYSLVWKGLDDEGNPVGSGIYFYHLKSNKLNATKKMILLK